jgi:hypothetical protein
MDIPSPKNKECAPNKMDTTTTELSAKEKKRLRNQKNYQAHKEKRIEKALQRYNEHKEERKEQMAEWYERNKEKILEEKKLYYQQNLEAKRNYQKAYRSAKKAEKMAAKVLQVEPAQNGSALAKE